MDKLSPGEQRRAQEKAAALQNPICPYCGKTGVENTNLLDPERKFIGTWCEHQWAESDVEVDSPEPPAVPTLDQAPVTASPSDSEPSVSVEAKGTNKTPRRLGFAFLASLGLFCITRGYSAVNASPSWVAGIGWFGAASALFIAGIWLWEYTAKRHLGIRLGLSVLVLCVMSLFAYGPVRDQYRRERQIQVNQPHVAHDARELKLAFMDSPLLTQARRDRIADELDRFYHYLVDLQLSPPTEASGGFGGLETRAITIGTTHTGPKAQMSFDPFDPILISEKELDNPRAASDAYADFAIQTMLPEIPEPQSHTNSKGALIFTSTIGSPGWYDRQSNRFFATLVLSLYFVRTFYKDKPVTVNSKYLRNWTSAISEIYQECGQNFTDGVLTAAVKAPEQPVSGTEAFDPYFLGRFRAGESTGDEDNRRKADGVLRKLGLLSSLTTKKEPKSPEANEASTKKGISVPNSPPAPPLSKDEPPVVNNCPNGICISGGTVNGPTVNNNFGSPRPPPQVKWRLSDEKDTLDLFFRARTRRTPELRHLVKVVVTPLDTFYYPMFAIRCDMPCSFAGVSTLGTSQPVSYKTSDPNVVVVGFSLPSLFDANHDVLIAVTPAGDKDIAVMEVFPYVRP